MSLEFAAFMTAFVLAAILLPAARRVARQAGFVDQPGGRKRHQKAVPPIGGLVVFPVFMLLAPFFGTLDLVSYGAFYAALALLLVTGAVDDRRGVKPRVKFAVQFVAALLIVLPGGARITSLGDLFGFGMFGLNFMTIPFSVIATVLLINAVNLMDGLDGLAGGMGVVVLAGLTAACALGGAPEALGPLAVMMGALCGFLVYNMRNPLRRKASVFLGDSGSLALGLTLAWFSIGLARGEGAAVHPVSVAWLLAIPIFDTCGQFARRVSQGRHPFDADHDHFHHHFVYAGFTPGQATAAILFLVGAGAMAAVWVPLAGIPDAVLTYPWIVLLLAHIHMSMRPHRFRRLVAKLKRSGGGGRVNG